MDSTENQSHIAVQLAVVGARGRLFGPARRIRCVLSRSHSPNFRKLTKLFSLLGFCRVDSNADIRALFLLLPNILSIFRGMSLHLRVGNVRCGRICIRIRKWVLLYGSPCRQTSTLIMPCFSLCFCPYPSVIFVVAATRAN